MEGTRWRGPSEDTPLGQEGGSHAQTLCEVSLGSAGPSRLLSEASGPSAKHGFPPGGRQAGHTAQGIQSLPGA